MYILRSSVIFVFILSVISSPILQDGGTMDLDTRESTDMQKVLQLREKPFPSQHGHDAVSFRKAPVLTKRAPSIRDQRRAAPKPKPRPKSSTTAPPKVASPPPPSSPQKPGKPKPPPANTPPKNTPPKNSASCVMKRGILLSKRAFDTTCSTASLTLGSVTRSITKVGDQGQSSITYKVTDGWPDSTGQNVLAFAKTGSRPSDKFTDEIGWLTKIEQLLASGEFDGRNFIVFRGAPGKHIAGTEYFSKIYNNFLRAGDINGCKAEIRKTVIPLVVKQAEFYVENFQVLHTDIHPHNVMFDESNGQLKAALIDWGRAETQPLWTKELEEQVRVQADRTFLEAPDTRICVTV